MATRSPALTARGRAKADRQDALLRAAAGLFAAQGFDGVSLEEIGTAVGVTGPAVYRHFDSKRALLGAILLRTSADLLAGGRDVLDGGGTAAERLAGLIAFHVRFALDDADVIRVHDRDLSRLDEGDRREVRRLQREYVDLWTGLLAELHPERSADELRVRAHAGFGLINSTPHSLHRLRDSPAPALVSDVLTQMATAALSA